MKSSIYAKTQTRVYNISGVLTKIEYDNTTDEAYKKLKVLKMAMDNWSKKNKDLPMHRIEVRQYQDDCQDFNRMQDLLQISSSNFYGTRSKKHKILMNKLFKRYNLSLELI